MTILISLAVIIGLLLTIVAMRPSDFRVTRSIVIAAPVEVAFAQVNHLRQWEAWNPWGKLDPHMRLTYAGPPAGAGASYAWAGNGKVGEGRNTIIESKPAELVRFRLEFFKPMKAVNAAEFTFTNEGAETTVTWTMTGKNNFVGKLFGLIIGCDKMVGGQFEKGLADMKSVAEAEAGKTAVHA
ncbi:MAG TPA: SRPBCC family protein [Verrucomicrobiae bacterium]|nr:SRPBCC family protein [Verrucomicrobiae bacterium]